MINVTVAMNVAVAKGFVHIGVEHVGVAKGFVTSTLNMMLLLNVPWTLIFKMLLWLRFS